MLGREAFGLTRIREITGGIRKTRTLREVKRSRPDSPVLVLVLEDDLVSSALIYGFLNEADYEVVSVTDGADALLELRCREFDLLILDVNVPTLNGLQVFEIMLQKHIDTPALFISGLGGTDVETKSLAMGASGFLRKPIRKDVLLQSVAAILQRARRSDSTPVQDRGGI
jgi:DNA-binding response OmpR family regulator